jgi:rhamnosyltransferase
MNSDISILIRTFNSSGTLAAVLDRLVLKAEDEIIVVDSGSSDATLDIARKHHARILIAEPPFNYSKSLNLGFRVARHPWVLVISSHCVPVSDDLLDCFREAILTFPEAVAVAYGERLLAEDVAPSASTVLFADGKSALTQQRELVFGSSGNSLALYRHAVWQQQPFDETLPTAEDLAWFLRALAKGALAARLPQARVLNRNQGSLRHMFRKGWSESRLATELTGAPAMTSLQLAVNFASLLKKWGTAKIPASSFVRQGAHALGAYLSPKFSSRRVNTGS